MEVVDGAVAVSDIQFSGFGQRFCQIGLGLSDTVGQWQSGHVSGDSGRKCAACSVDILCPDTRCGQHFCSAFSVKKVDAVF